MMQGTIERLRSERGFGFLRDPSGAEVFFHRSAVIPPGRFDTLTIGMMVDFEAETGPKGPRATTVTIKPELR